MKKVEFDLDLGSADLLAKALQSIVDVGAAGPFRLQNGDGVIEISHSFVEKAPYTRTFHLSVYAQCSTCKGTGNSPGLEYGEADCNDCRGSGIAPHSG